MNITINNREVEAREGETLIETARRTGISIPSLCYAGQAKHQSSCMVCAVRNVRTGQIIPSCTTLPSEGMQIDTESSEVLSTRTLSLELLLSDHRADCEAPCRTACPGNMDVALMNRLYDEGRHDEALRLLRDTLVIPATLCYICNAPCEKICRRGDLSAHVSIREIKKALVARTDLDAIRKPPANGRRIAVKGSDPMALSAAYHLRRQGCEVKVFEPAGELLLPHIPQPERVPADTLALEIDVIRRMGVEFVLSPEEPEPEAYDRVIVPQAKTRQPARLSLEGRYLAEGQEGKPFNSTYSRFSDSEKKALTSGTDTGRSGCLYCDCDAKTDCRLRRYASEYGIRNSRYTKSGTASALRRQPVSGTMWFEQAKCIKCGLCVYNSTNGFTFQDRGFVMQVVLPEENAPNIPEELAALCPTGALYRREKRI
jgi:predicted molibdopterin-dependent oxidoreductase YjgC